jgi:hypothetical protein
LRFALSVGQWSWNNKPMKNRATVSPVLAAVVLLFANSAWTAAPPPVNQSIGMKDVLIGVLTEAACRGCHTAADDPASTDPSQRSVPSRHHLLYGQTIPAKSKVLYPDTDGDGANETTYGCMNCHQWSDASGFAVQSDCVVCHTSSPHHTTAEAEVRHCKSCHGSVVDNFDDGHYLPAYAPSLVTPRRSAGEALPLNSRDNGAGACNYCHDEDDPNTPVIRDNHDLHHGVKFDGFTNKCLWCHEAKPPAAYTVRTATAAACENCHGPNSLHNIQADSPAPGNIGTIVVGGEVAGYGHVGRDAGPGNSDCWGCHGFKTAALAPGSGPLVPTVNGADRVVLTAGASAPVVVKGSSFINTVGVTTYEAKARLTAADGSSVTLQPDVIANEGTLTVTIPGSTPPGNYRLNALKNNYASNPVVISVIPRVEITKAAAMPSTKTVTITGGGFAGYAPGSRTSVIGTTSNGKNVKGTVVSWKDGKIVVKFSTLPNKVTVSSIYGSAISTVR